MYHGIKKRTPIGRCQVTEKEVRMVTEIYEVAKYNKQTDERIRKADLVPLFSGPVIECQKRADKLNADLSPREREEVEFRCVLHQKSYPYSMGPRRPRP